MLALTTQICIFCFCFLKEVKKELKEAKDVVKSEPKEEVSHATRREKSAGNVAHLVQRMSTIGIPTGGFQPHPPPTAKSKTQSTSGDRVGSGGSLIASASCVQTCNGIRDDDRLFCVDVFILMTLFATPLLDR